MVNAIIANPLSNIALKTIHPVILTGSLKKLRHSCIKDSFQGNNATTPSVEEISQVLSINKIPHANFKVKKGGNPYVF